MYINETHILNTFKKFIIPEFQGYLKKHNGFGKQQRELKGELFTKIRRYLKDYIDSTSYSINIKNIDNIGVDRDNNLISLKFIKFSYNFNDDQIKIIKLFNKAVDNLEEDISDISFKYKLDSIINSINIK